MTDNDVLARLRRSADAHALNTTDGRRRLYCVCGEKWPCADAQLLIDAIAELERLRRELAGVMSENDDLREAAKDCSGTDHQPYCRHYKGLKAELERLRAAPAGVRPAADVAYDVFRRWNREDSYLTHAEKVIAEAQRDSEAVGYARGVEAMREAAAQVLRKRCDHYADFLSTCNSCVDEAAIRSAPLPTLEGE